MKKCDCYCVEEQIVGWTNSGKPKVILVSRCNGTRERDECSCDGDRAKCNFYHSVREKAFKETDEVISGIPIGYGDLADWYISSVNGYDTPLWTEEHIEELFIDFYLIPKEN